MLLCVTLLQGGGRWCGGSDGGGGGGGRGGEGGLGGSTNFRKIATHFPLISIY